ncbi:MAG: chemotaxis protein CheW [Candidatus Natronoplasma sp.]
MKKSESDDKKIKEENKPDPTVNTKEGKLFTVFDLEGEEYGLGVDLMDEIVRDVEISRIPRSPDNMLGATNLRGEVIPVIDLKKILGLGETEKEAKDTIIIQIGEKKLAAPVDRVKDIVSSGEDQLIDPAKITNLDDSKLRWILRLEKGRSVRVINVKKLFEKEIKKIDMTTQNQ